MKVHDSVYQEAKRMADESDLTMKEAVRQMCRDGGHDV
jgi:hypothetical protein